MTVLPHISKLYADFLGGSAAMRGWYGPSDWMTVEHSPAKAEALANLLDAQGANFGAGEAARQNVQRLREGARAVVTGQQVGLLGGPILVLHKAATAVARAREAERATGVAHVPVFWLATEDHDLDEVDQVKLPGKTELETLRLGLNSGGGEVGGQILGDGVTGLLEQVSELLAYAPVCELLQECYTPEATLGGAFGRWMTRLFAAEGLVVLDASGREFHRLGRGVLRAAIQDAAPLEGALLRRTAELEAAGYHAQVLVKAGASLLFLLDESGVRVPLRRTVDGWKAGTQTYTEAELLAILAAAPERLSPNALLRPVFQDAILPTAAYVGGPAEIAYFAQSAVVYQQILGRVTPVLPRFSATLVPPAIGSVMARHETSVGDLLEAGTAAAVALRLGARAMPIEGKRKLAAVGNALEEQLEALTGYLGSIDANLGRAAGVSASKMRYQMNRLRRMAAAFEIQKEASLQKHANAMMLVLFPNGHPQERVLAAAWALAVCGEGLIERLVAEAGEMCVGHTIVKF